MIVETTSRELAKIVNGNLINSERPKTVIRGSREIVILAEVSRDQFLKAIKDVKCEIDAEIKVFVAPSCPFCPHVVNEVLSIPVRRIEIVDVLRYPEIAERYGILSTPTVLIGDLKLIGKVSRDEILKWMYDKREYIAKLLKDGRIDEVVEMEDVEVLVDLLTYRDIFVRLGSMVAIEEIAKRNPKAVEGVKCKIRELLRHEDYRIRQDVAMLLGDIGNHEDRVFLEKILKERFDESVFEAIEEIKKREQP